MSNLLERKPFSTSSKRRHGCLITREKKEGYLIFNYLTGVLLVLLVAMKEISLANLSFENYLINRLNGKIFSLPQDWRVSLSSWQWGWWSCQSTGRLSPHDWRSARGKVWDTSHCRRLDKVYIFSYISLNEPSKILTLVSAVYLIAKVELAHLE